MTLYTTNYTLDKYEGSDKPNLRDQYNSAMDKIDSVLKTQEDKQTSDKQELESKLTQNKNELSQKIDENKNDLNEKISQETEKRENADNQIKSDLEQANNDIANNSEEIAKLKTQNSNIFKFVQINDIKPSPVSKGLPNDKTMSLIYYIGNLSEYNEKDKYSAYSIFSYTFNPCLPNLDFTLINFDFNQNLTPSQLRMMFSVSNHTGAEITADTLNKLPLHVTLGFVKTDFIKI